jgi:hypothetical protein
MRSHTDTDTDADTDTDTDTDTAGRYCTETQRHRQTKATLRHTDREQGRVTEVKGIHSCKYWKL